MRRKETTVKNLWIKEMDGKYMRCMVTWHYCPNEKPYITISGYNPFPFFTAEKRLYTTLHIFNDWMAKNEWFKAEKITDVVGMAVIYEN